MREITLNDERVMVTWWNMRVATFEICDSFKLMDCDVIRFLVNERYVYQYIENKTYCEILTDSTGYCHCENCPLNNCASRAAFTEYIENPCLVTARSMRDFVISQSTEGVES